ncbi:MAG: zinc-dependent metalloprotease [Bacteroidetes bacterium]|nr:zinc-dependent metalloprotease [Bacteroidota bacterium]
MKKLLPLVAIILAGMLNIANAQTQPCGTDEFIQQLIASNPNLKAVVEKYEQDVQDRTAANQAAHTNTAGKTTATTLIPLVFHIVLSQAQIDQIGGTAGINTRLTTQVAVLNTDYNALNPDSVQIPAGFKSLFGNMNTSFGLAHTKPDGTGTVGYELKVMPSSFTGYAVGDGNVKCTSCGGFDAWDNTKYLNIWVTMINSSMSGGQVLGYAYNPGLAVSMGNSNLMGVVVDYRAFGKKQGATDATLYIAELGRTLVHEIGHFFTLNHIWGNTAVGSGDCSDDDGVGDTPQQKDANFSTCPTSPKTNCTGSINGEMFMNYMDYVQDNCMHMFSKGQVARMQSEFAPSGGSYGLAQSGYLLNWPTSINNISNENTIEVYPNPSNGIISVDLTQNINAVQSITVTNILGQTVKEIPASAIQTKTVQIDLSGLNKGIYTVQCKFEGATINKKIVLQ